MSREIILYNDTDSIIGTFPQTASDKLKVKACLNNLYGKMVSTMNWTYGKENKDMIKNYIVVHDKMNGLGIVFKDKIGGIFKDEDGTAKLLVVDGYMVVINDKYEDIVKQII